MGTTSFLQHLQTLGCTLRIDGPTLHVSPRTLLTPALREQIREHKAALMTLLAPTDDDPGPWGYTSEVLGDTIWFAWTEADAEALRAEGVVAYLPEEIMALHAMKARDGEGFGEKLRVLHRNKQVWGGYIGEVTLI